MCGIAGAIAKTSSASCVLSALRKLEYRGYDSAGISWMENGGIKTAKATGRIDNLAQTLADPLPGGQLSIGHTRWATHGKPSQTNAHPHRSGSLSLVHNGIITNAESLRNKLPSHVEVNSETDSEIIAHMIWLHISAGKPPLEALAAIINELEGSYAIAFIDEQSDGEIFFANRNSPIILGIGNDVTMLASDITAFDASITRAAYPENDSFGVLSAKSARLFDREGNEYPAPFEGVLITDISAQKDGHESYMMKEILEQPQMLRREIFSNFATPEHILDVPIDFTRIDRISLSACGTAFYACAVAEKWFKSLAGMDARAEIASEADFSEPLPGHTLTILVSQSGETADTLSVARQVLRGGGTLLGIVNAQKTSLERAAHISLNIGAGPEIGVASTKAFTAQLLALLKLAIKAGIQRGRLTDEHLREIMNDLNRLPDAMERYIRSSKIQQYSSLLDEAHSTIFLGKGLMAPIAMEGALKLKECSYIHAQGYPSGELKHGPIALVEEGYPIIALLPEDENHAKNISALEEVKARGARALMITDNPKLHMSSYRVEIVPRVNSTLKPFLFVLPLQMLALSVSTKKGLDVDRPRNLAKSVTV